MTSVFRPARLAELAGARFYGPSVTDRSLVRLSSFGRRALSTESVAKSQTEQDIRRNECQVQMLPWSLWQQIFARSPESLKQHKGRPTPNKSLIREHLSKFGLWGREAPPTPYPPDFLLPPLLGNTLREHFEQAAGAMAKHYLDMADDLVRTDLPPMPENWLLKPGWHRYTPDGSVVPVSAPSEHAVVFDVETSVTQGKYPTLAVAVSSKAWYGWVSQHLYLRGKDTDTVWTPTIQHDSNPESMELIPLIGEHEDVPRVVVGHSVSYDRARVLEEYALRHNKMRFLDTMAFHIATSGLSSQQRRLWATQMKAAAGVDDAEEGDTEKILINGSDEVRMSGVLEAWVRDSSPPSLKECYRHWCQKDLPKEDRDIFVKGTLADVHANFNDLMLYCAKDVQATHDVFCKSFPHFLEFCSHPATFAGMLEMGKAYLPVNKSWTSYVSTASKIYDDKIRAVNEHLETLANDALKLLEDDAWQNDPWLRYLDWTVKPVRYVTNKKTGEQRLAANQKLPGKPEWYKALWNSKEKVIAVTPRKSVAPLLLRMEWCDKDLEGNDHAFPLFIHEELKWGYLVPKDVSSKYKGIGPFPWHAEDGSHEQYDYFKLPHKNGPESNCGNPLSKEYGRYIESGRLRSTYEQAKQALDASSQGAYWSSASDRVHRQLVVWEDVAGDAIRRTGEESPAASPPPSSAFEADERSKLGVILPMIITAGTVTRRAVENTWLTASNPKKNRIGSELKSMVRAPPGYKIVGADVDSQELWIAGVLGDAHFARAHGSTAFGWMTLQGSKSDGTDMHSRTAEILGISRDQAKIVNYGRIYGASQMFATRLLLQFNPDLTPAQADERATDLYRQTKGEEVVVQSDGQQTTLKRGRQMKFGKGSSGTVTMWQGGTESHMFNRLEEIAKSGAPATPILGCRISSALQPAKLPALGRGQKFLRSRVNWVVQSSAVDFLHLMLVSMDHFIRHYDIKARLCITIHDEVRYLVADEDVERTAFALHLTNLLVRSAFADRLGIPDLPQSVAFFSAVDVDTVLRKEVNLDCVTPSNPNPIPPGYTLDAFQAGEAVGWTLEKRSQ